ncbi:protein of unknown function [Acidithiobacillus ferrivorans]|uniref:Uncharacterized protein n=1 Tax=Acidithiobacillus ferrivorans TaxID=160808 RepID=A0A060URM0_9PROT|nr:hypothetical protein AFERRI_430038 [Acidithiobacillus ferrivorans]SMH67400.1 protein of unknown function [Acidithiobacillus ferrivorans]
MFLRHENVTSLVNKICSSPLYGQSTLFGQFSKGRSLVNIKRYHRGPTQWPGDGINDD